jgi:hypothetical protein
VGGNFGLVNNLKSLELDIGWDDRVIGSYQKDNGWRFPVRMNKHRKAAPVGTAFGISGDD